MNCLKFLRWIHGWVSLSVGGLESICWDPSDCVFGRFDLALVSPLRLPHLKCLLVCLFSKAVVGRRVICSGKPLTRVGTNEALSDWRMTWKAYSC